MTQETIARARRLGAATSNRLTAAVLAVTAKDIEDLDEDIRAAETHLNDLRAVRDAFKTLTLKTPVLDAVVEPEDRPVLQLPAAAPPTPEGPKLNKDGSVRAKPGRKPKVADPVKTPAEPGPPPPVTERATKLMKIVRYPGSLNLYVDACLAQNYEVDADDLYSMTRKLGLDATRDLVVGALRESRRKVADRVRLNEILSKQNQPSRKANKTELIKAILREDFNTTASAIVEKLRVAGVTGSTSSLEALIYTIKSQMKRDNGGVPLAPKPVPVSEREPGLPTESDSDYDPLADADGSGEPAAVDSDEDADLRREIARFLDGEGSATPAAIARECGVPHERLAAVMTHRWFAKYTDAYELTPAGEREALGEECP